MTAVNHTSPRAADGLAYDSVDRVRGIGGFLFGPVASRLLGATSYQPRPLPSPAVFAPPSASRFRRGMVHYGIMIPDLPAPHLFMANMTNIGYSGFKAWDDDAALQGTARTTATVGHGTAATTHDPFSSHGATDSEFAGDGSQLRFGENFTISGLYPDYHLNTARPGFAVDLTLTATGEVTWFAKSPMYKHISLLTRYRGAIVHDGTRTEVAGLCTFEYGSGYHPGMISSRPLPPKVKIPYDLFTYHVLNLDADTQLLLAGMGMFGDRPAIVSAYLRTAGAGVRRLGSSVRFEVTQYRAEPTLSPDGTPMTVPVSFTWSIREGETTVATVHGLVDTQWLYAGMGNIAGYAYEGRFEGRAVTGRGYLEYSDRRT